MMFFQVGVPAHDYEYIAIICDKNKSMTGFFHEEIRPLVSPIDLGQFKQRSQAPFPSPSALFDTRILALATAVILVDPNTGM